MSSDEQRWYVSGSWCEYIATMVVVACTEEEAIAKAQAYWDKHKYDVRGFDWEAMTETRMRELARGCIRFDADVLLNREPYYSGGYRYPY